MVNYTPKNGTSEDYKEFEACMKPDREVEELMKENQYKNRHALALANNK